MSDYITILRHHPDSGCRGCPFAEYEHSNHDEDTWECLAAQADLPRPPDGDAPAPDWCPLRAGDVLVIPGVAE